MACFLPSVSSAALQRCGRLPDVVKTWYNISLHSCGDRRGKMRSALRPGFPLEARRIAALMFEMVMVSLMTPVFRNAALRLVHVLWCIWVFRNSYSRPLLPMTKRIAVMMLLTLHTGCTMWRPGKFVRSISNVMGGVTIWTRSSSLQLFQDKMQFTMMHLLRD